MNHLLAAIIKSWGGQHRRVQEAHDRRLAEVDKTREMLRWERAGLTEHQRLWYTRDDPS